MPQNNVGQTVQEAPHPKNEVRLEGNVGKDPRQQLFSDGGKAVNFSVAINHGYIDAKGEARGKTFWPNVAVYLKAAEAENFVPPKSGDRVQVSGRLETGSYQKNGQTHYTTDVAVRPAEYKEHYVRVIARSPRAQAG